MKNKIIHASIILFAQSGFKGVSIRDIASKLNISVATIYHHFENKEALYIRAFEYILYDVEKIDIELKKEGLPEVKLKNLINTLLSVFEKNETLRKIYLRELVENNTHRIMLLSKSFSTHIYDECNLILKNMNPKLDANMTIISIGALVLHHLQANKMKRNLPNYCSKHIDKSYIAEHISNLLLHGIV